MLTTQTSLSLRMPQMKLSMTSQQPNTAKILRKITLGLPSPGCEKDTACESYEQPFVHCCRDSSQLRRIYRSQWKRKPKYQV